MGKTVVITGAGVGLGRAIARRFASEGETCILLGRTLSKVQALAEELGDPHFAVECDVGDAQSVRAAFAKIAERHPKIDVLINNAAYYEPGKARDVSDEVIERIVRSNFIGPIYTCRAALHHQCQLRIGEGAVRDALALSVDKDGHGTLQRGPA